MTSATTPAASAARIWPTPSIGENALAVAAAPAAAGAGAGAVIDEKQQQATDSVYNCQYYILSNVTKNEENLALLKNRLAKLGKKLETFRESQKLLWVFVQPECVKLYGTPRDLFIAYNDAAAGDKQQHYSLGGNNSDYRNAEDLENKIVEIIRKSLKS